MSLLNFSMLGMGLDQLSQGPAALTATDCDLAERSPLLQQPERRTIIRPPRPARLRSHAGATVIQGDRHRRTAALWQPVPRASIQMFRLCLLRVNLCPFLRGTP
jgi:hypothetical protein